MNAQNQWHKNADDPLGLSDLEAIEPGYDGWARIESALLADQQDKRKRLRVGRWLAVAASLVLVISITLRNADKLPTGEVPTTESATTGTDLASVSVQDNINAMIDLSQKVEEQVKQLRQETSAMPAESAIYIAELEDLIAQVDSELSLNPDSIDLWGHRVNLMLDLAQIYQQQWQTDYGRMASL